MTNAGELGQASPTLIDAILRCGLSVYLNRQRTHHGNAPSNPYARLGNAVHRVLAWVATAGLEVPEGELDAAVRSKWREEVATEEAAASQFEAERYFGAANRWPGYASTEERLVIEAERLRDELGGSSSEVQWWIERPIQAEVLNLRGSPDLVLLNGETAKVIDYKSGHVADDDAAASGRYGRQILLYAAMLREMGETVVAGEVRPVGRPRFPVVVDDQMMDSACEVAATAISAYNSAIAEGDPWQLAKPGDDACSLCPHVLDCPALLDPENLKALEEFHVLRGTAVQIQQSSMGSVAIEIDVSQGTTTGSVTITGLDPDRIPPIRDLTVGDEVWVSGVQLAGNSENRSIARPGPWLQLRHSASNID